jgi:excinuclease ABC subunit C
MTEKQGTNSGTDRKELLSRARETSTSPGVYLMKDGQGVILYVGKAKNLRNRVSQYFQGEVHEIPRIELMVRQVDRFDVILTETEAEALLLECTLIKKHKPRFNVRLKDDKTYPYLKIRVSEPFPRIEWTRKVLRDGGVYFGPFPSSFTARQVLQLLNETFRLRDCSDNAFRHRSRPCILFQMERCSAPCVGKISREEYGETIREVVSILEGKGSSLQDSLRRGMLDAADRDEFELAAQFRDQLQNLERLTVAQSVEEAGTDRNRDVIWIARKDAAAHGVVLQIRSGKLVSVRHSLIQNSDAGLTDAELLRDFLAQYYLVERDSAPVEERSEAAGTGDFAPEPSVSRTPEVLLPFAPEEAALLESSIGAQIRVSESESERRLLSVAQSNAEHALEQWLKKQSSHGAEALDEIQRKLDLERLPVRIECYDISNTQGEEPVASRVVFVNGAPDKNLYRRYKIRTVVGSNDFAMMKEVLGRRFEKGDEALPDLVVVDGGKGQLAQAVAILTELSVQGVEVVGLAKARTQRDFRAKEVESSLERIFLPGRMNPVPLLPHTKGYRLLTHIRDEAHRFAISYHRKLRAKRSLQTDSD